MLVGADEIVTISVLPVQAVPNQERPAEEDRCPGEIPALKV